MRYVRITLAVFVFALAASGSIWIGWIYASPHAHVGKPVTPKVIPRTSGAPSPSGIASGSIPEFGSLPDLSSVNVLPGAAGGMTQTSELNGFPTVSKEAIERAAGYSDRSLPEVEIPFKIGDGPSSKSPGTSGKIIP